jgi:HEAT repeat protein/MFS family permease
MAAIAQPTTTDKLRGLPWSIAANALNTVFVQFTYFGPVFVLFLNEMNISKSQIGFLLSLFPFMGLVALFIAPMVARFGYKRTYLTFWGLRKVVTLFMLLVPLVVARFGPQAAVVFITVIVAGFGLCRAIAETGYYPWVQEFVPASIRGKFSATNNVFSSLVGVVAVAVASFVLGQSASLDRFMLLFGIGTVVGLSAVWMVSHVPGGAPLRGVDAPRPRYRDMLQVIRDRNLQLYLLGIALITFGTGPLFSFVPIFMKDQIGLSESNVVLLQTAALIGGLMSSYLLGWSADRYGSKPVMLSGVLMKLLLPVGWLVMPRFADASLPIALLIAFFQGVSGIAWMVGSGRMLFVNVVPQDQKSQYMAVYYALVGIIGGVSQLSGGRLLDAFAGVSGQLAFITLDPFTPMMIGGILLTGLSLLVFRSVRADSTVSMTEFAGMFVQGNPIYALESMMRYYRARDERATVALTEQMGQARSPLTVDEIIEALDDPRFNVRFEAVISIARTRSDPRLTDALCHLISGTELSLSNVAAWALGRVGDESALPALREGLDSDYRSVRAHCARAIGTLGDRVSAAKIHERLRTETDSGLLMAYAHALGNLRAPESIATIFEVMGRFENPGARRELALALARMVGQEQPFIRLLRQMRTDTGTAVAQELLHIKNRLTKLAPVEQQVTACVDAFAHEDLAAGAAQLEQLLRELPADHPLFARLLQGCADGLASWGSEHDEYIVLALHVLHNMV